MARKIVIDTDPGVDDVLAILLALASPEVDVALITPVFGNTHAPQTFANLLKIYYNLGIELESHPEARERYASLNNTHTTLVAVGEDDPIGGSKHVATYFHGKDGLSNISETHPEFNVPADTPPSTFLEISTKHAADAILDLLRAEPERSVTIVALGPLTNIAKAYRQDPETFNRVGEVVWMGGALDVPGNTSPVAEFNCFADPYAAEALNEAVKAGEFRMTFAPLDITTPHSIPFHDLLYPGLIPDNDPNDYLPPTRLQAFTTAFLLRVRWLQKKFGNPDAMEMHDPVAIWYAIAQAGNRSNRVAPPGWTTVAREFAVERDGQLTRGMCVVDRRGTGETTTDRTQDKELMGEAGVAVPDRNATSAAKDGNVPPPTEDQCNCNAIPDMSLADCPHRPVHVPHMIASTPGTDALRRTLLSRVFGTVV